MEHSKLCNGLLAHMKALEPRRHEIPEVRDETDQPTVVFSKPMTTADHSALAKYEDGKEYDARLVVRKALNEDGTPAFLGADAQAIIAGACSGVIGRIALAIYTYKGPKAAELKN